MTTTTGINFRVDDNDYEKLSERNWTSSPQGYIMSTHKRPIPLHRIIMKAPKGKYVDHIDRDITNNQKSNLRLCTPQQSVYNRGSNKNSSSRYKGVSWNKRDKKWSVAIKNNGKLRYVGTYTNERKAALAYNREAARTFGEFAYLNKVDDCV